MILTRVLCTQKREKKKLIQTLSKQQQLRAYCLGSCCVDDKKNVCFYCKLKQWSISSESQKFFASFRAVNKQKNEKDQQKSVVSLAKIKFFCFSYTLYLLYT